VRLLTPSFRTNVVLITVLGTMVAAIGLGISHYRVHKARIEADLKQVLLLSADESANRFKVHSEVQIFDTAWNLGVLADFGLDKDKDGPSNIAVTFTRPLTQEFFSGLIK